MAAGPVTAGGAQAETDGRQGNDTSVTLRQAGDVTFVHFRGLADAVIDLGSGTVKVDVCPDAPPGMDQVLAGGPVLALALALRGQRFLHARAVSIGGRAVAFAAPSGGGKSTLGALACQRGAELVADDTLALAVDASEVRCLPGSREFGCGAQRPRCWPRLTGLGGGPPTPGWRS